MINKIFDQTLKQYRITGKMLSDCSGVSASFISEFRNAKANPGCDVLQRLLDAADTIAPGSKRYFSQQLAGGSLVSDNLESLVVTMSSQEISTLLHLVADRYRQNTPVEDKSPAMVA